jgi:6-phosphogluconolactonase
MVLLNPKPFLVYVGTYTQTGAGLPERPEGLFVFKLNPSDGSLEPVQAVAGISNPTFLALTPDNRYLYAVKERDEIKGQAGGEICAFSVDPASGRLALINSQPTLAGLPCHVTIDPVNRYVWVASYAGGRAVIFPILQDGSLGAAAAVIQHAGHGSNPQRQEKPHVHSVTLDPQNQFALAADLGVDKIFVYRTQDVYRKSAGVPLFEVNSEPGGGPRHLTFHPDARFVYALKELTATVACYTFDLQTGALDLVQNLPTLPADFHGPNLCADLHVTPNGKFLYVSNRGHDCIARLAIDPLTGRLALLGYTPTLGKTPRNFAITPDGGLLLAANQESDSIVAFRIDSATGDLTPTGAVTRVPAPACIKLSAV